GTDPSVTDPSSAIKDLQAQKDAAFKTWQAWQDKADCERDGASGCGGTGLAGKGPNWRDDEARAAQYKLGYDQTSEDVTEAQGNQQGAVAKAQQTAKANLAVVSQDLATLLKEKNDRIAQNNANVDADSGLLARLNALSRLTTGNPTLRTAEIA